ncbi:hypothetical protein [Pectobacterium polaris]|uniref:hypothetical protein n=1 Tax=Pectobacterium polaris TaxID=2042057 RepID=UPI001F3092E0|nr:hypothetical protein [Pectobacterium polaris]
MPKMGATNNYVAKLVIVNASDTTLNLQAFTLSAGSWLPDGDGIPMPGTPLTSGHQLTYFNQADNTFSAIGGSLTFAPANGGFVIPSWDRKAGAALSINASITSDTLTIQATGTGVATNAPTAQYIITNITG